MIHLRVVLFSVLAFACIFAYPTTKEGNKNYLEDKQTYHLRLDIQEKLKEIIEKLKEYDPYHYDELFLPFDLPELIGNMTTSNITAEYFSEIVVNKAILEVTSFDVQVSFDRLHLFYHYKGYGLFYHFIPMWGDGISDIKLNGATIGVKANVIMTDINKPISLAKTKLDLHLDGCKIEITGLLDNPELGQITADALTDFIMIAVNDKLELVNQKFAPLIEQGINNLFVTYNITPNVILGN